MKRTTLLAIDDEEGVHYSFRRVFPPEVTLHSALSGKEGLQKVREVRPDVALVDMKLPDTDGLALIDSIRKISPRTSIIIITAYATGHTTMEAMARGAFDFITKPFDLPLLLGRIEEAASVARFKRGPVGLGSGEETSDSGPEGLVGMSPAMAEVYKLIGRLAPTQETVLIHGESGTGKELVARAIIQHSSRRDAPYLAINCAAFPETLLEAELFGYEKGAFTGATARREGKFEACQGGTILLDEIGDMPLPLQAKLLRVLQEKEITRLGSTTPIKLDVRILAATHRDLKQAVAEGKFRQDLFYRLTAATISLPPLRERREDIPRLARHLVRRIWLELQRPPSRMPKLSSKALRQLERYDWPGNVRELENVLRQTLLTSSTGTIQTLEIDEAGRSGEEDPFRSLFNVLSDQEAILNIVTERFVELALEKEGGNLAAAARRLGLSRNTLRKYKQRLEEKKDVSS
ncbi:MAG: sigma-54-dependent Fis family transcriptional regulator [Candidatus Hydrogenedentota bacterium]|nr:MAG: sigma-54-dependent Fis family transcriptional regulator [Candidatus Hydrogenedentota bacterium]